MTSLDLLYLYLALTGKVIVGLLVLVAIVAILSDLWEYLKSSGQRDKRKV